MPTVQKSLRIPDEIAKAIEEAAETSGRDFSTVANELIAEAVKMRRCPGILFADGPSGRRARITSTGLDVWEVIATYQGIERDVARLHRAYHWLSEAQLRAALGYYAAYPEEIDRQIARNAVWTQDRLAERYPSLAAERS
jgi:uncharacterized protein (DUF433 family)